MYRYDDHDRIIQAERVAQFSDQVRRRLSGDLTEEQFRPLRLMNGLYLQLHAYMLRVAIPYGLLSSTQLRMLARIAREFDRGYGHFTTRQNIQYNWPALKDVPRILELLASVEMHANQTSGNCVRNVTSDPFAGAAADELDDPRVWAEIIRQWSTFHPEFSFLPRKFKIAITGSPNDRAAVKVHDIGLRMHRGGPGGAPGFEVLVGGGQGRTPFIAKTVRDWIEPEHLLAYLEACLRVYNRYGRRDNKFKARIKILVHELGMEAYRQQVDAEFARLRDGALTVPEPEIARIRAAFADPPWRDLPEGAPAFEARAATDPGFAAWARANLHPHKRPGYAIATVSLKPPGAPPGDATDAQMEALADLADRFSFGQIVVTHRQNLVLAHVEREALPDLYDALVAVGFPTANVDRLSDIICCPGLDYCSLANARSIPIAQELGRRFADPARLERLGPLTVNISGCINACGHHHVANIGILGVDKKGEEFYQLTLGGAHDENAAIGKILGPGFSKDEIAGAVEKVTDAYLDLRREGESFRDTLARVGLQPFKDRVYAAA